MKKILIVEDEAFLADVLAQKIQGAGYTVEQAPDGAQGLTKMKAMKPDLIITDAQLPFVNGIEMLQKKKEDPEIAAIPSIMLIATKEASMDNLGVAEFIVKAQATPEQVLEKVIKIVPNTETAETAAPVITNSLEGKKIMLVEDDTFLSNVLSRHITSKHANVTPITTGEAAIEAIKKEIPDIVVLDILLPGINGFEVLDFIRSNEPTKNLPVIVASNFNQPEDRAKAQAKGAKFLVKALVLPDDIVLEISKSLAGK